MYRTKTTTCLVVAFAVFGGYASAQVPITVWKAELNTSGDWFDNDLWTAGVPTEESRAWLVNRSETTLDTGEAQSLSLSFAYPVWGRSRLTQIGGRLNVEEFVSINDGIYRLLGGSLKAKELKLTFDLPLLFGVDLADVPQPDFCQGIIGPGESRFCVIPSIALNAQFQLDGGEVEFTNKVTVDQGQLQITGGRMKAGGMFVDAFGFARGAAVSQRGGIVDIDGELKIQNGTYALSGGELTTKRLAMGDPAGAPPFNLFLPTRSPEFVQTGGSVRVLENLDLCVPGFILPGSTSISSTFTDITYRLEAGSLRVDGNTVVGSLGVAPARFIQSGGTHRTAGTLRIEGAESIYEITGGKLRVDTLAVGTDVFNEGGTFTITAGAEVVVDSRIVLGALAEVEATPGSQIRLDGGEVEILGTDASLLAGLGNLSLMVTSGDTWSTLEAASNDLGQRNEGFENNFGWAELLIGGNADVGQLRLVDLFDNQPGSGAEAIYVDRLVVEAGSTLDLGGLNLYYREANIAGQVILSGGSLLVAVPEPPTVWLTFFAVVALGLRKRDRSPWGC